MPSEGRPAWLGSAEEALMSFVTGLDLGPPPGAPGDWVVSDARASAEARVDVYRYMYGARLVEALQSQYPCLAAALGDGRFAAVVHGYAGRHPSRHPSIRELGRGLADDLEAAAFDQELSQALSQPLSPELPAAALADLARLEWARADVFDAVDEDTLTVERLRGLSPDAFATLGLERIEASRLLTVRHPVCAWWDALAPLSTAFEPPEGGVDRRASGADGCGVDGCGPAAVGPPEAGRQAILIWRQGVSVYHRPVEPPEERALAALGLGSTLGALCEPLADASEPEDVLVQLVFGWLWTWARDGLLRSPG
jgi:hypothetical protein